jgi:hypothetical protein
VTSWRVKGVGDFSPIPSVHFDTSTWLSNASLSTVDSPFISFSYWFKVQTQPFLVWVIDPNDPRDPGPDQTNYSYLNRDYLTYIGFDAFVLSLSANVPCNGGGILTLPAFNPLYGDNLTIQTFTNYSYGDWHHILVSVQTNLPVHAKKYKMYLDDVDITAPEWLKQNLGGGTGIWSTGADSVFYTCFDHDSEQDINYFSNPASSGFVPSIAGLPFFLGNDSEGGDYVGDLAEFWFFVGHSLLDDNGDIPEETRRKFIPDDGKPVPLGPNGELPTVTDDNPDGTPPTIFGHGSQNTFLQPNLGTGGDFTLTGNLSAGSKLTRAGEE